MCYTMICWSCTICDSNLRSEMTVSMLVSTCFYSLFYLLTENSLTEDNVKPRYLTPSLQT